MADGDASCVQIRNTGNRRPDHTTVRVMLHPVLQQQTLVGGPVFNGSGVCGFRVYRVSD
jgi:hypothetical protein